MIDPIVEGAGAIGTQLIVNHDGRGVKIIACFAKVVGEDAILRQRIFRFPGAGIDDVAPKCQSLALAAGCCRLRRELSGRFPMRKHIASRLLPSSRSGAMLSEVGSYASVRLLLCLR